MPRKYYQPSPRRRRENDPDEREYAQLRKELQEDLLRTRETEEKQMSGREELRQLLD